MASSLFDSVQDKLAKSLLSRCSALFRKVSPEMVRTPILEPLPFVLFKYRHLRGSDYHYRTPHPLQRPDVRPEIASRCTQYRDFCAVIVASEADSTA
jgi:hypothetical protein